MEINQSVLHRSRLGQLLVEHKLITEEQLSEATQLQQSVGKRLGEILVEQGLVAQKHINRVLRKQKRMRMLALAVTVLVAPFQMARADDLSPSHDLYTATQQELIKTFEAQVTLGGNGGNEDAGDIAKVIQTGGIQNAALISQHGNDQVASISQSGNHNLALIAQR